VHQVGTVAEPHRHPLDPAVALDEHAVGRNHHDVGHALVGHDRLERPEAECIVEDALHHRRTVVGAERPAAAVEHRLDLGAAARREIVGAQPSGSLEVERGQQALMQLAADRIKVG